MKVPYLSVSELHEQQKAKKNEMLKNFSPKLGNFIKGLRGVNPLYIPVEELKKGGPFEGLPYSSERIEDNVSTMSTLLKEFTEEAIKLGFPKPILAGGAIRDTIVGLNPKDYDIFIDVSSQDESELDGEDQLLLLVHRAFPSEDFLVIKESRNYGPDTFVFYDITRLADGTQIQVLGHKDKRIHENPLDFVASFGYNIVQGFLLDDQITLSAHAVDGFKTKQIVITDQKMEHKANLFPMRFSGLRRKEWKVSTNYPKKKDKYTIEDIFAEMKRDSIFYQMNQMNILELRDQGI